MLVPLSGSSHAQSDALKCQRAVVKEVSKFFKAKTKALQKCEEGKAKGKREATEICPDSTTQDKIDCR